MSEEFIPIEEGRTHINIYSKSMVKLGRSLSNFSHTPFVCPVWGDFQSLEGYWYYVKLCYSVANHERSNAWERLRNEVGIHAKQSGQEFEKGVEIGTNISEDPKFRSWILEATRCKLRQNKDLREKLGESRLPLTHYYYFGTIDKPNIVRLPQHQWQVDEIIRCRKLLQEQKKKK